jgi:hypothetical protein
MRPRTFKLVSQGHLVLVPIVQLMSNCHTFQTSPSLFTLPYRVRSIVPVETLRVFVDAISGADIDITPGNASDLEQLCTEFGFVDLAARIADHLARNSAIDAQARRELSVLKDIAQQQPHEICVLQEDAPETGAISGLRDDVSDMSGRLADVLARLDSADAFIATLQATAAALEQADHSREAETQELRRDLSAVQQQNEILRRENAELRQSVAAQAHAMGNLRERLRGEASGRRPIRPSESPRAPTARRQMQMFVPSEAGGLCGIIAGLVERCGGDVQQ